MKTWILRILTIPLFIFSYWQGYALLTGWVRMLWGHCPLCNSDAPALYHCPVCSYYHGPFPPSEEQKKEWDLTFWEWLYRPEHWTKKQQEDR